MKTSRTGDKGSDIDSWCGAYWIVIVGDFVKICQNRSQYSHIRRVPGISMVIEHEQTVAARAYRARYCVNVGRELAIVY